MVVVSVSETYDLSTKSGKMTLIGVHTPTKQIIQHTYPGLCMNSKYCRIVKQDVTLACASMLPASVSEIGLGQDDIAPQDLFNPILYKAVSNDSFSTLEARLQMLNGTDGISGYQATISNENVTGLTDEFNVYYSLLSNRDGFRTANPQQGLTMRGLVPLVFEKYYNIGENTHSAWVTDEGLTDQTAGIGVNGTSVYNSTLRVQSMRGKAHSMPRFNTTFLTGATVGTGTKASGMGDGTPVNGQTEMPDIMPVYTACIIMPPSKRHLLFYRMVVRTYIEFSEVRPIQEITTFSQMDTAYAPMVYHSDYNEQSKVMTATLGMVDAANADLEKIMEGS